MMTFVRLIEWLRVEAKFLAPRSNLVRALARFAFLGGFIFSSLSAGAQCGGVILLAYNKTLSPTNWIYLQVILSPPEAVQAGAGWRLYGEEAYHTNSTDTVRLTNNAPRIEFNTNVPGWAPPAFAGVQLTNDINIISNVPYLLPSRLAVTPEQGLSSMGVAGGPFDPAMVTYTLSNPGQSCIIFWSIDKNANWLSLSSTNGTLRPGESTNVNVFVNTNANSLIPGNYFAGLAFTNSSGAGNAVRLVTLGVRAPPFLRSLRLMNGGALAMTLQGETNRVYSIQRSSNLVNWADILSVTNSGGSTVFTSPPAAGWSRGFYRAKEQP